MSNNLNNSKSKNIIIKEKGSLDKSSIPNNKNMLIDTNNSSSPQIDSRIVPEEHFMNSNDHLAKNIVKNDQNISQQFEEEFEIDEEIEDYTIDSRFKEIYSTSRNNNKDYSTSRINNKDNNKKEDESNSYTEFNPSPIQKRIEKNNN